MVKLKQTTELKLRATVQIKLRQTVQLKLREAETPLVPLSQVELDRDPPSQLVRLNLLEQESLPEHLPRSLVLPLLRWRCQQPEA